MKYTINVQGVCYHKGQLIDEDIWWPGARHDAKVFAYSSINTILHEQAQPYLTKTLLPGKDKVGMPLLGDTACPLLPHVMKEYAKTAQVTHKLFSFRCYEMQEIQLIVLMVDSKQGWRYSQNQSGSSWKMSY